ncbi:hypothetical protein J4E93_005196 [Alternaria ventricosa]|uniref:uncharacterized protein n=1 Tax=Alternaria ventricosa TaxID=1187951 RepID=UPI0020C3F83D|nr:uncharacterized protein J4E93_005196 [Alternaria ventricosa]KAI4646972.1 hypothetical protein J4E93_005196 [Alternaria ventricosa]
MSSPASAMQIRAENAEQEIAELKRDLELANKKNEDLAAKLEAAQKELVERRQAETDDIRAKILAIESGQVVQGPSKSSKLFEAMEQQVKVLRMIERQEEHGLDKSLSASYRARFERNQILMAEIDRRAKILREPNDAALFLEDPEVKKWLI